jgi:GDP-mannose 6-dehydrogenase
MMIISVFGLGYVGAVTIGCLAKLGHKLIGVDINEDKVRLLDSGQSPISEPGLTELLSNAKLRGRLEATSSVEEAVRKSDSAIVCVGTPSTSTGAVNEQFLTTVVREICETLMNEKTGRAFTIFVRSTCLPQSHLRLLEIVKSARESGFDIRYVCHPEFLREGSAIEDFFEPPKIVFGIESEDSINECKTLYPDIEAQTFFTSVGSASMIKYADNCFHAAKVTFANEIGLVCKAVGVSAQEVMDVFCSDQKLNISARYLRPGAPFGGSCLPKDLRALLDLSRETASKTHMLAGIAQSNQQQIESIVTRIVETGTRSVGIIGLAFKERTDDLRESPAVVIAERLLGKGFGLSLYDSYLHTERLVGANREFALRSIPHLSNLLMDLEEVLGNSELVLMFHSVSPERLKSTVTEGVPRVLDFTGGLQGVEGIYW